MKKITAILAITLAATLPMMAGDYGDISFEDLKAAIKDGKATVIDVNGSTSYAQGHIPGAIDFAANKEKLGEMLPAEKDALVVAYCGSEKCSAYKRAAKAAQELGYTNGKHFSGGLAGWKANGGELKTPDAS